MSEGPSAICLVIDRLSAGYLGAYGNTWIRTPAFDQLAAQSLVFTRAMIDSPDLNATYRSFWTGQAAWRHGLPLNTPVEASLPHLLQMQQLPTVLLTDAAEIAEHAFATFDEVIRVSKGAEIEQAAEWDGTQTAAFFASAIELLNGRSSPAFVWLHCSTLSRIWDSPSALRDQYSDPEDPPASQTIDPPCMSLDEHPDPDLLLGLRHAYAGEITVMDWSLAMLLDTIDRTHWRNALLVVMSPRGYPLGEHGIVGAATNALYGELVHVPLLLRSQRIAIYGDRCHALAQPADVFATLIDWSGGDTTTKPPDPYMGRSLLRVDASQNEIRKLALVQSSTSGMAIATSSWYLHAPAKPRQNETRRTSETKRDRGETRLELFVKPDDYFEVNDVATRCPEVIEEFQEIVNALERAHEAAQVPEISVSSRLTNHVDG